MKKKVLLFISSILSIALLASCGGEHVHSYGEPTFSWDSFNLENSTGEVYASFKCNGCDDTIVKRATVTKEEKEVTCTEGGYKKYTATYTYNDKTYTDKKEINFSGVLGHSMIKHSAVEATCQRPGNIIFYSCANCGKKFTDFEGKNEVTDVSIPKLNHDMTYFPAKEQTCTSDGCLEHYHCCLCELDYEDEEGNRPISKAIIPGGHSLLHHEHRESSCTKEGSIEYYECTTCHKNYSDAAASNEITGDVTLPKKSHILHEHAAKEATCLKPGNVQYWTCDTCDNLFSDPDGKIIIKDVVTYKDHEWSPSGYCRYCSSRNLIACVNTSRVDGTLTETSVGDLPSPFKKVYLSTGNVGGGTSQFFNTEDISKYVKIEFAIKTMANPANNEKLYLKVWKSTTEVFASDGWVNISCTKENNNWTINGSNGICFEAGDAANLYALLDLHHPSGSGSPIPSDFYISEVIGYTADEHVHEFGSLIPETNSTCSEHGHIAYYECASCGMKQDTNGNVVDSVDKPLLKHEFGAYGKCSLCSAEMLEYKSVLWNPTNMSDPSTEGTADGFQYSYTYNAECGGGKTNCFFANVNNLSGIVSLEFAIKTTRNELLYIRPQTSTPGAGALRVPYQDVGASASWVYFKLTRPTADSLDWTIVSSQPAGKNAGPAINQTVTITSVDYANSLWGVCTITNQNYKDTVYDPIIISEIIAKKANYHNHKFGDLINGTPSTCGTHGTIDHFECEICSACKDTNGNVVPSIDAPLLDHTYDTNGECTQCHKKIFSYADHLQNPEKIAEITDGSIAKADGFNKVYKYTGSTGGGMTGGFLKHEGNVGLGSWENPRIVKMEFAVMATDADTNIRLMNGADSSQNSLGNCFEWVYVTAVANLETNQFVFTNSANSTVITGPTDANTMFAIFRILNENAMYITEFLVTYM